MSNKHANTHQKAVLKGLLLAAAMICFAFFILNISRSGLLPLAFLELSFGVISLLMVSRLKHAHHDYQVRRFSLLFLFMFYCTMMYAFTLENISNTVYVWMFLVPILSYFLLGITMGFIFTAIFSTAGVIAFVVQISHFGFELDAGTLSNLVSCMLGIWALSHVYEKSHKDARNKLFKMASHDDLTGLPNRSALKRAFADHLKQNNQRLSIIVIDIDHFKLVNDRYGHEQGDKVLKGIALLLQEVFDSKGQPFRLGGEEFCVLLPGQSRSQAVVLAERALSTCRNKDLSTNPNYQIKLTISAGIAEQKNPQTSLNQLLNLADNRLYKAKHNGRNQVISRGSSNHLERRVNNEQSTDDSEA